MMHFPQKCVVDTNVPKTANMAMNPATVPPDLLTCVMDCVEAIDHIVKNGGLVLDAGDEIFDEYRHNLSMKGQPGIGDRFMKWVHDKRWTFPDSDRVSITKTGETYMEFPSHHELSQFDKSDRKFVAVANAHPEKPPVLEATDSKWWGWMPALATAGITVQLLCPDYLESKYREKMET
ncbi:MAG: hypothetical protein AB7S77_13720 [Desulfatirhabdiaceae bacterium]